MPDRVDFEVVRASGDRFVLTAGRSELNMLQRAIQGSPYEEVRVMWERIVGALMRGEASDG